MIGGDIRKEAKHSFSRRESWSINIWFCVLYTATYEFVLQKNRAPKGCSRRQHSPVSVYASARNAWLTTPPPPPWHTPFLTPLLSGQVGTPGMRGTPPATQMIENLTCCALNTPSAAMGMGAPSASHVTVGTLGRQGGRGPAGIFGSDLPPQLLQLDPLSGLQLVKIVELPEEAGVTAMTRG